MTLLEGLEKDVLRGFQRPGCSGQTPQNSSRNGHQAIPGNSNPR